MLLKRKIDLYFSVKRGAIVLLIGLLFVAGGLYATTDYPTYTTTEEVVTGSYSINPNHYAIATSDSKLYSEGDRVENRKVYFSSTHKKLHITYGHSNQREYTVTTTIEAQDYRVNTVIWSEKLEEETVYTHNETNQTITVDIPALRAEMKSVRSELPTESRVTFTTVISSETPNTSQEQSATVTTQFDTSKTYRVETNTSSKTITESKSVTEPVPSRTATVSGITFGLYGAIITLLGLAGMLIGGYLIYGAKYGSRDYKTRLYKYHLEKYSSWITLGRPFSDPEMEQQGTRTITVDSLEGLVHIAVDSDTRVIYSEELERFYVFSGSVYFYSPPVTPNKPYQQQLGNLL